MHFALSWSYLLTLALSVVAAGFLIRTFIIMHDCGHGSFFRSRRANDLVGFVTGALTLTPYAQWSKDHAIHHATSGQLDRRGYGDIGTLTVSEYLALGRVGRLKYRLYRHPAVLLGLGPMWLVLKQRFHTPGSARRREVVGVQLTNATVLLMLAGASLLVGPGAVAAIYAPTVFLSAAAGIWLFYVQHQYEGAYWASGAQWDYATAAVSGSSFYRLPRVLDWFTGSIGFHHVHHLSPRIPNYYLRRAHQQNPYFQQVHRVTLRESVRSVLAQAVGRGRATPDRLERARAAAAREPLARQAGNRASNASRFPASTFAFCSSRQEAVADAREHGARVVDREVGAEQHAVGADRLDRVLQHPHAVVAVARGVQVAVRVLRHEVDALEDVVELLLVAEVGEDERRLRELLHDVVDLLVLGVDVEHHPEPDDLLHQQLELPDRVLVGAM